MQARLCYAMRLPRNAIHACAAVLQHTMAGGFTFYRLPAHKYWLSIAHYVIPFIAYLRSKIYPLLSAPESIISKYVSSAMLTCCQFESLCVPKMCYGAVALAERLVGYA